MQKFDASRRRRPRACRHPASGHVPPACSRMPCTGSHDPASAAVSPNFRIGTLVDAGFHGFSASAFEWFAGLERDNSRTYFSATRDVYEREVRDALEAMFEELREEFGGEVRMFRQHRDVRFSPDKSPYKTTAYGILEGALTARSGLYAQLSARGLYAGSG